jgi:hypothetical protein
MPLSLCPPWTGPEPAEPTLSLSLFLDRPATAVRRIRVTPSHSESFRIIISHSEAFRNPSESSITDCQATALGSYPSPRILSESSHPIRVLASYPSPRIPSEPSHPIRVLASHPSPRIRVGPRHKDVRGGRHTRPMSHRSPLSPPPTRSLALSL